MHVSTATPDTTTRNIESECDAITAKACCVCYHMTYSDYNALLYIHTIKVSCKVDKNWYKACRDNSRYSPIPTSFVVPDGCGIPSSLIANNSPVGRQISSGGVGSNC